MLSQEGTKKILITGGTGFVGRHLVRRLCGLPGVSIVLLTRNPASFQEMTDEAHRCTIKIVRGDLSKAESLGELALLEGVDAVVHFAAEVSSFGPKSTFYETNVVGTKNLLSIMGSWKTHPVFLFASSIAVYGFSDCHNIKEDSILEKSGWAYADSKIDAEELIKDFSRQNKNQCTILRIGDVLGRGSVWVDGVINQIKSKKMVLPKNNNGKLNYILVEDLVNITTSLLFYKKNNTFEIYNVTSGKTVFFNKYFSDLSYIIRNRGILQAPYFLLFGLSLLNHFFCSLFNIKTEFTPQIIQYVSSQKTISVEKMKRALGESIKITDYDSILEKIDKRYANYLG